MRVPPLRERKEDIPLLVRYFIDKYNRELRRQVGGVARDAMDLLRGYAWPGNIRELSNTIERAMIFSSGPELTVADLPVPIRGGTPLSGADVPSNLKDAVRKFEADHIRRVIAECGGNKRKAAKMLGLGATSLYRKLGLDSE